jgi:nuclear transport factor 2 (NTF2) superfamily protein
MYLHDTWLTAECRIASINEHPIAEVDRKFRWPLGCWPDDDPGLGELIP